MSSQSTTSWACSATNAGVASLTISKNGGSAQPFSLKGVCYSPAPINGSNATAPAIGDWFWDSNSGTGYSNTGWDALWDRDLPNIRALGANTVRVYSMLSRQLDSGGGYPSPHWDSGALMTHTDFLDKCWNGGENPLYVMVGIPLPQAMFWHSIYETTPQSQIEFWTNVLSETVAQVASHPAVIGFIIQNEWDSNLVTWGNHPNSVPFWWSQVELMAQTAKTALGTNQKLIGMAVHDNPNIAGTCQTYMAACTSMDFWGVNTYQTVNFNSIFNASTIGPGYGGLTGAALKPVILTEWGLPATGHRDANNPATIYADATTIGNTATYITNVAPNAYAQPLCLGMYYFEYCDEWWNQGGAPNIHTWYGGTADSGFPNGFWDQDGFGLFSQARGGGLPNSAPIWTENGGTGAPALPIDIVAVRQGTYSALCQVFDAKNFPVYAIDSWQDTGLSITAAQTVDISYLAGLWTANPNDNNGALYGATGNPQPITAKPGYAMPGQNEGALVGKIGNDVFLIGNGATAPAGLSGKLMLCINDDLTGQYGAGLTDNSGLLTAKIKVS